MLLAVKTVEAINNAIEADEGSRFKQLQKQAFSEIEDAFSSKTDIFRSHLGASVIGRPCAREIWYAWHWAKRPRHSAQLLRLFNRGHLEEARFIAMLRLAGCEVWRAGTQVTACHGHFGGTADCVVRGLPDLPTEPVVGEFKTHNAKSFTNLVEEGVQKAKWEHYVQSMIYTSLLGLDHALYLASNKDTDHIYAEILPVDNQIVEKYLARAQAVIDSTEPPARINSSPAWYQCRFCDYKSLCHQFEYPEINCRTCAHSTPVKKGWNCERFSFPIGKECLACEAYICNPTMLNGIEVIEANHEQNTMTYRLKTGELKKAVGGAVHDVSST